MGLSQLSAGKLPSKTTSSTKDFTLLDYKDTKHTLSHYKNSKALVVMFIATRCPVSNAYNTRMAKLYNDYQGKNVVFLGINANKQENEKEIARHAKDQGFKFPVLKVNNNVIADKFKAQFTPEIFVLNADAATKTKSLTNSTSVHNENTVQVRDTQTATYGFTINYTPSDADSSVPS